MAVLDCVHMTFMSVPLNSRCWQKKTSEFIAGILIKSNFHSRETFRPNLWRSVSLLKNAGFSNQPQVNSSNLKKLMCLESCG